MADAELKPCPFCGGAVELERTTGSYEKMHGQREWWGVVCRNTINVGGTCAIQQVPSASKEAAVERWNRRAATKAAAPADAPTAPMCERKTNDIIQREGYKKTGYVLRKEGADICVVDGGAVAWFTLDQWNWLMFNRMHTTFDWPKPIGWRAPAEDAREEVREIINLVYVQGHRAGRAFGNRVGAAPAHPGEEGKEK